MAHQRIAGDGADDGAGRHAESKARRDAPQCRQRVAFEFAALRQLPECPEDHRRRRHQAAVRPAVAHRDLPEHRQRNRHSEPQQRARIAQAARLRRGSLSDGFQRSRSWEQKTWHASELQLYGRRSTRRLRANDNPNAAVPPARRTWGSHARERGRVSGLSQSTPSVGDDDVFVVDQVIDRLLHIDTGADDAALLQGQTRLGDRLRAGQARPCCG